MGGIGGVCAKPMATGAIRSAFFKVKSFMKRIPLEYRSRCAWIPFEEARAAPGPEHADRRGEAVRNDAAGGDDGDLQACC